MSFDPLELRTDFHMMKGDYIYEQAEREWAEEPEFDEDQWDKYDGYWPEVDEGFNEF